MKSLYLLLLTLLVPALAQAGAGSYGDNVVISSGTRTVGVTDSGNLKVEVISQPNQPVIIQDESAADSELGRSFHAPQAIQTLGVTTEFDSNLWVNRSTSQVNMILDRIYMSSIDTDVTFRFYVNPVVTSSGTALVEDNSLHGSTITAMVEAYTNPTISDRNAPPSYIYRISDQTVTDDVNSRLIFQPGNTLLLTVQAGAVNKKWNANLFWVEK